MCEVAEEPPVAEPLGTEEEEDAEVDDDDIFCPRLLILSAAVPAATAAAATVAAVAAGESLKKFLVLGGTNPESGALGSRKLGYAMGRPCSDSCWGRDGWDGCPSWFGW